MTREISRLQFASEFRGWPSMIPHPRPRGVKALGKRYEAAVAKELGTRARQGVWWEFRDANGPGLCQTDFVIGGEVWALVLECKHTWTEEGMVQLRHLYMPVVEWVLKKRVIGIQVCKNLAPETEGQVYNDLVTAVEAAKIRPQISTLHWRGLGPLLQRRNHTWPAHTTTRISQQPTA